VHSRLPGEDRKAECSDSDMHPLVNSYRMPWFLVQKIVRVCIPNAVGFVTFPILSLLHVFLDACRMVVQFLNSLELEQSKQFRY
jgi:hypothetical protein